MIARIASEMARPDFAIGGSREQMCRDAISTGITEYQKQRFRFSDINPAIPTTFNTVPGQSVYQFADNANIPTLYIFDYVNVALGNTLQQLGRVDPERIHLDIQQFQQSGFPTSYAYEGNSIIIYPVPDIVYPVYIGAHLLVPAPQADDEANNPWMTVGVAELLIRSRAKFELSVHVTRNNDMAALMSPDPPGDNGNITGQTYRAWKSLKGEANKITGTGKVRAMRF